MDDANTWPGETFTLSATVTDAGDGESEAITLRHYWSTDSTITSSNTEVGADAVGALAAAGTGDQSIRLTATSETGTYYYGAYMDSVAGECPIPPKTVRRGWRSPSPCRRRTLRQRALRPSAERRKWDRP